MRSHRRLLALVSLIGIPSSIISAASCGDGGSTSTQSTGAGGSSTGTSTGGMTGAGGSTGNGLFDASAGCNTSADCNGGVCVNGICCAAATDYCAGTCCSGGTVCLFDKCVTPGKDCQTANDCDPGQYCETALGNNGGGGMGGMAGTGGMGSTCLQPLPLQGKCLDLPPVCDPDAGAPGPDAGCVQSCEYHPPVGQLNAVAKWQWGPTAQVKPNFSDIWSTPTVGRVYDGNCDGKVDELDSPNIIFVSGNVLLSTGIGSYCADAQFSPSRCKTGVLRMLDGRTGQEIWSLAKPDATSIGFAGTSVAIGDVDGDGWMDVVAATGEGYVVLVDHTGKVVRTSDQPIPGNGANNFGWGGGFSIADMDGDGFPEIAFGRTVFTTTNNAITLKFTGTGGMGGSNVGQALSALIDLDGAPDGHLELLAGRTAYKSDGTILWDRPAAEVGDGFPGVGDFDGDGKPDVLSVQGGKVWILEGATGVTKLGPVTLPGTGSGGPPTVADFDGDGKPEIGVAQQNRYSMLKPDFMGKKIDIVWAIENHDLSSSVTGSSVFDFEGDGRAEVVYADECFLWVYDGQTGAMRFATPHSSFTATEASLVADVDGDGRSEMIMISNAADPSSSGWKCNMAPWNQPDPMTGRPAWKAPPGASAYRGMVVFGDKANSWVGTRTLWNQHTYHVTNICDNRDSACDAPNTYGSIPKHEKTNWNVPWLNNFRQNVQDKGIFDAPDAMLSLLVDCASPVVAHVAVRNIGLASLPAGVDVAVYVTGGANDILVGQGTTTQALFPGQTEEIPISLDPNNATTSQKYIAKILLDPNNPKFHECREDNNESAVATPSCVQ